MNNAMHSYKQAQFNTIGRADLTIMLYDGAIRFLDQAKEKIIEKDMQAKGNLISKTIDILNELDASLNIEQGGDLAKNLHELYFISTKNLLMANLKLDISIIQSVQHNIQSLRDAFAEAMQTPEAKSMLKRMGPPPQQTTAPAINQKLGGDINARAEIIKEAQAKAKALELAQNKLKNATTQEEKEAIQEEIKILLQKKESVATQKTAPVALAQKASLAFAKTNTQLSPVSQVETTTPRKTILPSETVLQNRTTPISPGNTLRKTGIYANTQTGTQAHSSQKPPLVTPNLHNVKATAVDSTQPLQNMQTGQTKCTEQINPTNIATDKTTTAHNAQANLKATDQNPQENPQQSNPAESQIPTAQTQNTTGLLNRKMALYKNIHNG